MPSSGRKLADSVSAPISPETLLASPASGACAATARIRPARNRAIRRLFPGTSAASSSQSMKAGYPPSSM